MAKTFHFQASAVGVGGRIGEPFNELIPAQASAALPDIGGVASARVCGFRHRFVSFREARTELIGVEKIKGEFYQTLMTTTVEGLNIMDVVTADRVVARLVSKRDINRDTQPLITPVGSYFENLRIAGEPVRVRLATDLFNRLSTYSDVKAAVEDREDVCSLLNDRGESDDPDSPEEKVFGGRNRIVSSTLVDRIGIDPCGIEPERNVVKVPGFGTVRLAQFHIAENWRRLTMIEVEMGSPPDGRVSAADVQGDGTDW